MVDVRPPVQTTATVNPFAGAGEQIARQEAKKDPRELCKERGGYWDEITQKCILVDKPTETTETAPKATLTSPEVGETKGSPKQTVTLPDGRTFSGLNKEDVAKLVGQQTQPDLPLGAAPAGTAQKRADVQFEGQQLAGQVGQFGELGVSPTGLQHGEAITTGIVGAIPRALSLAAGGLAIGAAGGTAVLPGVGTIAGGLIGAAAGFVSGMASSMIGSYKSQRSDTTTAQQRILDEGKQTLKDWATLAKSDPTNRAFYLAEYNKQAAQINQAYRQMKLDTSKDVAKFETALPNLAEFEAFYSNGGERDALDIEMQTALQTQAPEGYDLLELGYRRGK